MTTVKFYGRTIPANHRNIKVLMFVFYPAVLLLSYTTFCFGAWALCEIFGLNAWGLLLTLPAMFSLCLELEANHRKYALLPETARKALFLTATALSVYVFWRNQEWVKFAVVVLFVVHQVAHFVLTRYWAQKESEELERQKLAKGFAALGSGQPSADETPQH